MAAARRREKKKKKRSLLPLITLLIVGVLVFGILYSKGNHYLANFWGQPTKKLQLEKVANSTVTPSTTEAGTPPMTQDQNPDPVTEIVWEKQESPIRLPILMYHAIHVMAPGEEGNANLIVDPTTFESHLQALLQAGYYTLSPEEAYKMLTENVVPKDKKAIWLTFDDSLWDFYDIAYPLLKKYQMKATNNVITGTVGQEANLSLDEMKEMKENGISLQGHTVNHPQLDSIDPTLQNTELAESKNYLDSNLGQDTISLAYPSGGYTEETTAIAERNHFKMALTTNEGLASAADGLFSLNRVRILPSTTAELLLQSIATE